jgi:hypothetical protein
MQTNQATAQWRDLVLPPERFEAIEVRLEDGRVHRAVWTGAKWWSDGREVSPTAWRPIEGLGVGGLMPA